MPPWKSEPGYGEFVGQQPLTDAEITRLQQWADSGAPEGRPQDLPPQPHWTDDWRLGTPDLIVTLPGSYVLRADGPDELQTFSVPLPIKTTRYVRGMEFRPASRAVHHADFALSRAPTTREREQDPSLGEEARLARIVEEVRGEILGWTAGQGDGLLPNELTWRLEPGQDLVVQLHLQPIGKAEAIQGSIGFYFTDTPPTRTPTLLRLGRQNIDIPSGEKRYVVTDSFVLPTDVEVRAVRPHAHWRAREVKGFATLPDGSVRWLLYIKDWDFRWQNVYRYVAPLELPKGTRLTMEYTYDNSADNPRNPTQPPERVRWGPQTADEMGDFWVQMLPRDDRDLALLVRTFAQKSLAESVVGYETLVETHPADMGLRNVLAFKYLELGRPADAVPHFASVTRATENSAAAHFNLGMALRLAGQLDAAFAEHRTALRLRPAFAAAHYSLGQMLAARGDLDEAFTHYLETVRLQPEHAGARNNVGFFLMTRGRTDEALSQFREALRIDPESPDAHYNIAVLFQQRAEPREAVLHFREALHLRPNWALASADLAWVLATTSDDGARDVTEAVRVAEQAATLTHRHDVDTLDVLAAAYAAASQFDRALDTLDEALRLNPPADVRAGILDRQARYRAHQSYRAPAGFR